MADAFGGSRVQARPPERGIFPLDHEGECRQAMKVRIVGASVASQPAISRSSSGS